MLCGPGRMLASMDHAPRPRPLNRRAPPRCVSFSVRSEPVPVPEEHDRILPRPGHRPLHRPSTVLSPPVHRPFAAVQGVAVQAYRALGQGKNLGHPAVMEVAAESGRTATQVRGRLDGRVHSHTPNRRACECCECCAELPCAECHKEQAQRPAQQSCDGRSQEAVAAVTAVTASIGCHCDGRGVRRCWGDGACRRASSTSRSRRSQSGQAPERPA